MKVRLNHKLTIFLLLGLLVCFSSALTYRFLISNNSKVTLHSLEIGFSDIKSLVDKSDLIVIGEFKKIKEDIKIDRRDYYMLSDTEKKEDFTPIYSTYSVSDFKIEKIIKGSTDKKETIELLQELENPTTINNDLKNVKKFKEGDKYILFLRYYDLANEQSKKDFKTPKYFLVNPIQGKLEINKDAIVVNEKLNPIFRNTTPVETIEKMIKDNL